MCLSVSYILQHTLNVEQHDDSRKGNRPSATLNSPVIKYTSEVKKLCLCVSSLLFIAETVLG